MLYPTQKKLYTPIASHGRIDVFDSLRSQMIFFVIILHVSMTFMLDTPSWWYVISEKKSPVFVVIVNILDVFMIPILFFISGYFTPASFLKKKTWGFLKDKIKHIATPWILGIFILVPLFPLCSGKSVENIVGLIKENPLYLFNNQSHLWYLGILFLFLVAYALYANIATPVNRCTSGTSRKPIPLLITLIVISGVCSYLSNSYLTDFDNWINFAYIFSLKPAKIVTNICVFILGIYAWQQNWFTKDGWMPKISCWRILAISSMTCYMVLRLLIIPNYDYPILSKVEPIFDSLCSFLTLIYLIMTAIKFQSTPIFQFLSKMASYSYGIYWIHIPLMILFLYLINSWDFPIFIKWISGIIFTTVISWLICKYILKKAPFLKQLF